MIHVVNSILSAEGGLHQPKVLPICFRDATRIGPAGDAELHPRFTETGRQSKDYLATAMPAIPIMDGAADEAGTK